MNLSYQEYLPADFDAQSKVWVYQCNRILTMQEALETEAQIESFVAEWASHGDQVKAAGFLFFGQFLILMADETVTTVGGCSTDGSMRFVKSLEKTFSVNFFDRTSLAFVIKDKVQLLPYSQVQYALDNKFTSPDTLYFNNLVATKQELENNWLVPLKESWLKDRLAIPV